MTTQPEITLSRRDFLKRAGVAGVAAAACGLAARQPGPAYASEIATGANPRGILIDLTRCTGCEACVLACKDSNNLANPDQVARVLDSDAYTCLEARQVSPAGDDTYYVKRQCMHCLHPACASACTVGALSKTADGPVVYDSSKCIGCRYCQYACPFGVPTYEWENPLGLISKCQFCSARLAEGQAPACAVACPNGALRFGLREELLVQAHAQITSNPGRYVDHIYGEFEAGGTSMLYLSGVPFAALGLPDVGEAPIPYYAEAVMRQTPVIALTVATVASGLSWFLKRRELGLHIDVTDKEDRS